jgi:hypothetical protein
MDEKIYTTSEILRGIVIECLADLNRTSQSRLDTKQSTHLYSIKSLATFLGCSVVTAQKLKNSGKIRFKQYGRKCIFNTEQVLEDLSIAKKH